MRLSRVNTCSTIVWTQAERARPQIRHIRLGVSGESYFPDTRVVLDLFLGHRHGPEDKDGSWMMVCAWRDMVQLVVVELLAWASSRGRTTMETITI